jgi:hypothetical protein
LCWDEKYPTKQETLEEAAEKYCLINNIPTDQMIVKNNRSCEFETPVTMFIKGVAWQSERMYSEEEVNEIIAESWNSCEDNEGETYTEARKRILEQFKKK